MADPKIPRPKAGALTERGQGFGLYSTGIINSQDYNAKLTGTAGIEKFNEMRLSDATVRAALLAIDLPLLAARWWIEPGADSRFDKKVAEFVEKNLFDGMTKTWQETLNEILLFLPFGRMPFEIVWQFNEDGMITVKKLASRWPATIWSWKLKNGDPGLIQRTINGEFEIPMEKLIVFVNQKEGDNWEGVSILRSAYKHWLMKDKMYLIDAMAMERQGLGVPYAKKPTGGTTEDEESDMEEMLENIRANEKGYAIFREGWEVGFLDMKAGTIKNPTQMVQHHDRQITKNVLAQFLELGAGSVGSFALSQDQSKLFLLSLEAVANYIKDNINKYLIKKLVDFNFDVQVYPTLAYEKIGNVDYAKLMVALQQAVQMKLITPDPHIEEYLRDIMDLPEFDGSMPVDETLIEPITAELNKEMNDLSMSMGEGLQPTTDATGQPVPPQEQTPQQAFDQIETWIKTNHLSSVLTHYGSEIMEIIKAGSPGHQPGVPLSEETKRKISEALSKGKGKGKKGKGTSPEITKRREEIRKVQAEVKSFNDQLRREMLEMKAKGVKLSPEETAKKQLEYFDKKKALSDRISTLKNEIEDIKSKTPAAPKKPATADEKPTSDVLLKMSEEVSGIINDIRDGKVT